MSPLAPKATSAAEELASRIEKDIRRRGLGAGDRYLTAEQAGKLLAVSRVTANRAMQLLAQRRVLVRARSRGTFVGERFAQQPVPPAAPLIRGVHVMMAMDYHRTGVLEQQDFAAPLAEVLPGTNLHIHYITEHDPLGSVKRVVEQSQAEAGPGRDGFIFIRSSRDVQQYVADQGLPAVIFGSVYPGIEGLNSLDVDMAGLGSLMARYALGRGHERMAIIMRHVWRRGDNLMLESVVRELGVAGLAIGALQVRSIPPVAEQVRHEVAALLAQEQPPALLFCLGDFYAEIASEVIEASGRSLGEQIELVAGVRVTPDSSPRFAHVAAALDGRAQVRRVLEMLAGIVAGRSGSPQEVLIPVELHEPGRVSKTEA